MGRRKAEKLDFYLIKDQKLLFLLAGSMLEKHDTINNSMNLLYFLGDEKLYLELLSVLGGSTVTLPTRAEFVERLALAFYFYKTTYEKVPAEKAYEELKPFFCIKENKKKIYISKEEVDKRLTHWFCSLSKAEKRFLNNLANKTIFSGV